MKASVDRNKKKIKFHNNLLEGRRVNFKTFLGLAAPNQYCQTIETEMWGWFLDDILGRNLQTFIIPNIRLLPYCMIMFKVWETTFHLQESLHLPVGKFNIFHSVLFSLFTSRLMILLLWVCTDKHRWISTIKSS